MLSPFAPSPLAVVAVITLPLFFPRRLGAASLLLLMNVVSLASSSFELRWQALPPLPDPEGFASSFAGVAGGRLIVAGGANFPGKRPWEGGTKVWYDVVYALAADGQQWQEAGRLSRPLAYGASFNANDGVVCAGGADVATHHRTVFWLGWRDGRLVEEPLPALPAPSAYGSGVRVGNSLYLVGGTTKADAVEAQRTLWRLRMDRPRTEWTWEELEPCPGPGRMLAQVAAIGDRLFVCGGVALTAGPEGKPQRSYLNDAWCFDFTTGWRKLVDMPYPVAAAPSPLPVSRGGQVALVSGDDGTRGHLIGPTHPGFRREVLVYDFVRNRWDAASGEAPLSRATAPVTEWQGRWVIASGEARPGCRSNEMWAVEVQP